MTKKSFVKGAAILAVSGLIVKFIGFFFRIPLTYIIGSEGMGLYGLPYPIYNAILVVSTAGLPVAISKMVSEKIAHGSYREAHQVFGVSWKLLAVMGLITSLLLFTGSGFAARITGNPKAIYSFMAIAPSLFFASVLSAIRGYFQGMQIMTPTAVTQIVEQVGKLILGLWLASLWVPRGIEYGAAGALLGVTLSEAAAFVLILGIYRRKKREITRAIYKSSRVRYHESAATILLRLVKIAVPVMIGASVIPLVNVADAAIVVNRLKDIYSVSEATSLFGLLTQYANPLINFPATLTIALAMSLVPAISESYSIGDSKRVAEKTITGVRLTLLMGLPAAVGMMVLSQPIIRLLYTTLEEYEIIEAGQLLMILSFSIIFLTLVQSLTAILQGINKVAVPVINLFIGALFKIFITFTMVGIPSIHVRGAAIGTLVCYGVAAFLDFAAVARSVRIRFSFMELILKPLMAVGTMAVFVHFAYQTAIRVLGNTKAVLLSISIGVFVYGIMLLITGAVRKQDFELLPRAKKIGNILERLRLLKN